MRRRPPISPLFPYTTLSRAEELHRRPISRQPRNPRVTLAFGALLHDVGKPPTFRVADRIRFEGHVEEGVRLAHGILTRLRFLERPDRADRSADRPPHALQGYRANRSEEHTSE